MLKTGYGLVLASAVPLMPVKTAFGHQLYSENTDFHGDEA